MQHMYVISSRQGFRYRGLSLCITRNEGEDVSNGSNVLKFKSCEIRECLDLLTLEDEICLWDVVGHLAK